MRRAPVSGVGGVDGAEDHQHDCALQPGAVQGACSYALQAGSDRDVATAPLRDRWLPVGTPVERYRRRRLYSADDAMGTQTTLHTPATRARWY